MTTATTLDKELEALEKRAETLRAKQAQAAQQAADDLRDARKAWAADVIDGASDAIRAASAGVEAARERFMQACSKDWPDLLAAVRGWHGAVAAMDVQHRRYQTALSYDRRMQFGDTMPNVARVPPFIEALATAIADLVNGIPAEVQSELTAELQRIDEGS
jgi:hypothetical protein